MQGRQCALFASPLVFAVLAAACADNAPTSVSTSSRGPARLYQCDPTTGCDGGGTPTPSIVTCPTDKLPSSTNLRINQPDRGTIVSDILLSSLQKRDLIPVIGACANQYKYTFKAVPLDRGTFYFYRPGGSITDQIVYPDLANPGGTLTFYGCNPGSATLVATVSVPIPLQNAGKVLGTISGRVDINGPSPFVC